MALALRSGVPTTWTSSIWPWPSATTRTASTPRIWPISCSTAASSTTDCSGFIAAPCSGGRRRRAADRAVAEDANPDRQQNIADAEDVGERHGLGDGDDVGEQPEPHLITAAKDRVFEDRRALGCVAGDLAGDPRALGRGRH